MYTLYYRENEEFIELLELHSSTNETLEVRHQIARSTLCIDGGLGTENATER